MQQRIKVFLWLLSQDKIMTNHARRRSLTKNPSCQLCGSLKEDGLYTVRDFPSVAEIWKLMVPSSLHQTIFLLGLKE